MKINILLPRRMVGTTKWGIDLATSLEKHGIDVRVWRGEIQVLKSLFLAKGDLIHSTVPIPWKPHGMPLIFSIHGYFRIENNPYGWAYPRAINIADLIVTPTEHLKRTMNLPAKTIVIPNGVALPDRIRKKIIIADEFKCLTITNFYFREKAYGIVQLVKNLNNFVMKKKINTILNILGTGPLLDEVMNRCKNHGKLLKVNFLGFQNPAEYFRDSDIFLYYSKLDVMPLVILEALSQGMVVLTNEYGAAKEIIDTGKNGFIAQSDLNYVEILGKIFDKKFKLSEIEIAARSTIVAEFNDESITKCWIKFYREIISNEKNM